MTDSKPSETIKETSTVDVNQELQTARITSEKHKTEFIVSKPRVARFFGIKTTTGSVPLKLAGKYSSLEFGIKAVQDYIKNSKETFAVKSDRLHEERQQRKNAESQSKNS